MNRPPKFPERQQFLAIDLGIPRYSTIDQIATRILGMNDGAAKTAYAARLDGVYRAARKPAA